MNSIELTPESHLLLFGYTATNPIYVGTVKAMWVSAYLMGGMTADEVRAAHGRMLGAIERHIVGFSLDFTNSKN